jgi:simple sugar transport system ATP-binding protein
VSSVSPTATPESGTAERAASDLLLEARGLEKAFGHVQALSGVDLDLRRGEVLALVGDNGAGKSTLIKCLSGSVRPDFGEMRIDGRPVEMHGPLDAREHGIETVYQDLALADDLEPALNIFLGRPRTRSGVLGQIGFLDRKTMRREASETLSQLGISLPGLTKPVSYLSGGQRQGVAIARAYRWARSVLIMDEPTAALGVRQSAMVLDLIRRVRESGLSVILISHSMPDVFAVADRIAVLRLGENAGLFDRADVTAEDIIKAITGASTL